MVSEFQGRWKKLEMKPWKHNLCPNYHTWPKMMPGNVLDFVLYWKFSVYNETYKIRTDCSRISNVNHAERHCKNCTSSRQIHTTHIVYVGSPLFQIKDINLSVYKLFIGKTAIYSIIFLHKLTIIVFSKLVLLRLASLVVAPVTVTVGWHNLVMARAAPSVAALAPTWRFV